MKRDIILAGVGGQGILSIATVIVHTLCIYLIYNFLPFLTILTVLW